MRRGWGYRHGTRSLGDTLNAGKREVAVLQDGTQVYKSQIDNTQYLYYKGRSIAIIKDPFSTTRINLPEELKTFKSVYNYIGRCK
jgi:hypothetical protein